MCVPQFIPMFTAIAGSAGGSLALAGGLLSGIAGASAKKTDATNYENAAIASENRAMQARESGIDQSRRVERQIKQVVGTNRAAAAESGLAVEGSVADVIDQNIDEATLDLHAIRYSTGQNVWAAKTDAATNRNNARRSRRAAPLAFLSPIISAAGSTI